MAECEECEQELLLRVQRSLQGGTWPPYLDHSSAIIREVTSCSRWQQNQRPHPDNELRVRDLGTHSPKQDVSIKSCRRGDGKSVRAMEDGGLQGNKTFSTALLMHI